MPDDDPTMRRLPNPARMLLADESAGEYDALLQDYFADMEPVGALERRQVELILRCDVDIDRQFRMIAQHLNPLGEEANRGAQMLAEWYRLELRHPDAPEDEDAQRKPPTLTLPEGDARLTPLIASRYAQRRELIALHHREVTFAERRRRQAIELLHRMQDRRRRASSQVEVADAEVIEATEASEA